MSIYNSSSPEELQYLAEHAEARVIIVEDSSLDRVLEVRDQLPLLEHIFVIEEPVGGLPEGVCLVDDLLANGEALTPLLRSPVLTISPPSFTPREQLGRPKVDDHSVQHHVRRCGCRGRGRR